MGNQEIWVYVEINNLMVEPTSFQLITKAKQIANGRKVVALIAEPKMSHLESDIKEYGPDEIRILRDERFRGANDEELADALFQVVKRNTPNAIIFPATVRGRSVAPRLQAKLQTGLTADCLDIYYDGDNLVQVKPTYGDGVMCNIICPDKRPQMVTVRPNIFEAKVDRTIKPKIQAAEFEFHEDARSEVEAEEPVDHTSTDLTNAKVIIALGRGAYSEKNVELARQLAEKLGGKVGVSRPLTDKPEFTHSDQIGQSGTTVSPDLLINLGISGAVQYTVGVEKAKKVISVNTNRDAPIFDLSDYGYVGDAGAFLEAMLGNLE